MQTLAFQLCTSSSPRYVALLHTAEEPRHEEWKAYVAAAQELLAGAESRVYAFVVTDGGSPNALQRRMLADVVMRGNLGLQTHVFTTNLLVRSVVTAFSWIAKPGAVAHAPRDFANVCQMCGLSAQDVIPRFGALQRSIPKVFALERVIESLGAPDTVRD
jgi:hypothetical protein